ncbi:MAG: hypothetical protein LC723_12245 [Actinobacteria bacterium]|nr:hypothetical protein [Actinomycetota bacterium]
MSRKGVKYVTLCIALNGFHGEGLDSGGNTFSSSGIYAQPYTLEGVLAKLISEGADMKGCFLIDKRPAIAQHGAKVVFRAPMCDPRLVGSAVHGVGDLLQPGESIIADALASEPGNGFGDLVRGARAGLVNLDSVSPAAYAAYWKSMGAIVTVAPS